MRLLVIIFSFCYLGLNIAHAQECGADRMGEYLPKLEGKKVALLINQTSVVGKNNVHLLDTLLSRGVDIVKIFTPEHGFRGNAPAGEKVDDSIDSKSGLPIVSLYGKNRKPTHESLSDIDVLIFDIQDVGARFYTYISTLLYTMESLAPLGKELIVLDRPNPNDYIDGAVLKDDCRSFVGAMPLPVMHGLTMGELAQMINAEKWAGEEKVNLTVIPIKDWVHGQSYSLKVKPSPNLPNDNAITLYASLCIFEATKFSVGRGTYHPFEVVGYPDAKYGDFSFTPVALEGFDNNPKCKNELCYGIDLRAEKSDKVFTLKYLIDFIRLSKGDESVITSPDFFDKLMGDKNVRKMIEEGFSERQIRKTWTEDLEKYKQSRKKYLLYKDY